MAAALIATGALLTALGALLYDPRAAVVTAGVLMLLAGVDLTRPGR